MFNEQASAGMEIKQKVDETFENPYTEKQNSSMPEPVILFRSKEGIQRWLDEKRIGEILAETKGVQYNEQFVKENQESKLTAYLKSLSRETLLIIRLLPRWIARVLN